MIDALCALTAIQITFTHSQYILNSPELLELSLQSRLNQCDVCEQVMMMVSLPFRANRHVYPGIRVCTNTPVAGFPNKL